jgi:hypothetical protein
MGTFTREGTFRDKAAFFAALRGKLEKLRDGTLRGSTLVFTGEEASLEGFGAKVVFKVGDSTWTCVADLPSFIPVPQRMIEAKFDEEFSGLNGL